VLPWGCRRRSGFRSGLYVAILALVAAASLALRLEGVGLKDYSAYRAVYAALAETDQDASSPAPPPI